MPYDITDAMLEIEQLKQVMHRIVDVLKSKGIIDDKQPEEKVEE